MSDTKLKAPKGKYRVVGVDTFANEDWLVGDYNSSKEAKDIADKKGGSMTKMYVYDHDGKCLHEAGTY